jgi:hypothetical protein
MVVIIIIGVLAAVLILYVVVRVSVPDHKLGPPPVNPDSVDFPKKTTGRHRKPPSHTSNGHGSAGGT